ncbi:hypothetical protein Tco_1274966 [Tanacetum coccineum]
MPRCIAWDEMDNPSPQVLSSFEVYTPPITYPKEGEETLGTSMEVYPLDQTQLEDVGLNTCIHDLSFSSREVPSFDELEPQPQTLPSCSPLHVSLGDEKGLEPPIKPYILDSYDRKKHYGFEPGLLGHSGSLGVDFSNLEMIEDDWQLESKEVYFLRNGLNLPVIFDIEKPVSSLDFYVDDSWMTI